MDFYLSKFLLFKENLIFIKGLHIASASLIILLGITHLLLCIFNVGSFRKKKMVFLLEGVSISLINLSSMLTIANAENIFLCFSFPLFLFALTLLIYLPISFFNERVIVITEKQREFVRAIDKSIVENEKENKKSFTENNEFLERIEKTFAEKKVEKIAVKPPLEEKEIKEELNFTHVKNVLERLNYFNLSPADRKTVIDLKSELFKVENIGLTRESKIKINDGLSSLLKIMSKYSV